LNKKLFLPFLKKCAAARAEYKAKKVEHLVRYSGFAVCLC